MDDRERRKSYVWSMLVLSWPAFFFLGFATFVLAMFFSSSDRIGDDLDKFTLESGTESTKLISGNVTVLRIKNGESICHLTYRKSHLFSSNCTKNN